MESDLIGIKNGKLNVIGSSEQSVKKVFEIEVSPLPIAGVITNKRISLRHTLLVIRPTRLRGYEGDTGDIFWVDAQLLEALSPKD